MKKEVLKVSNIEKYYGNKSNITKAINNINFTVEEGEFVGVMGASGSGKTTVSYTHLDVYKRQGKTIELYYEKMVGNVAGIIMSKEKYDELIAKYGSIKLKNVTEAVANGEINMGYTNPFASATGLNFLVSTLSTFDSSDPLSCLLYTS